MYTHTYLYLQYRHSRPRYISDDLLGIYPSSRYTREVYIVQFIPFPESRPLPDRIGLIVKPSHPDRTSILRDGWIAGGSGWVGMQLTGLGTDSLGPGLADDIFFMRTWLPAEFLGMENARFHGG